MPALPQVQDRKSTEKSEKSKKKNGDMDLKHVFYNRETQECTVLGDFCDNAQGCIDCYHSWQEWYKAEWKKGKNADNSTRQSYLDFLLRLTEENL